MTVTIEDVKLASVGSSTSGSIALTPTILTTDLIFVVVSCNNAIPTLNVAGSAFTQYGSTQLLGSTTTRMALFTKTGVSGTVSVAYSTSFSTTNKFTVYVVRGLTNRAVTAYAQSDWSASTTAANTDEGPSALPYDTGQVAVFVGVAGAGTLTFPSNTTPASGWTTNYSGGAANGDHNAASHIATASGTVQANIRSTATVSLGGAMVVLGDVVSVPPLTSTFVGWGSPIF